MYVRSKVPMTVKFVNDLAYLQSNIIKHSVCVCARMRVCVRAHKWRQLETLLDCGTTPSEVFLCFCFFKLSAFCEYFLPLN